MYEVCIPILLAIPVSSLVVPFWDYLIGFLNINHKKELLRSLWVYPAMSLYCTRLYTLLFSPRTYFRIEQDKKPLVRDRAVVYGFRV